MTFPATLYYYCSVFPLCPSLFMLSFLLWWLKYSCQSWVYLQHDGMEEGVMLKVVRFRGCYAKICCSLISSYNHFSSSVSPPDYAKLPIAQVVQMHVFAKTYCSLVHCFCYACELSFSFKRICELSLIFSENVDHFRREPRQVPCLPNGKG